MITETNTAKETKDFARSWVENLGDIRYPQNLGISDVPKEAMVVALYGDLGSGKTTFVQGVAAALGIEEAIVSPTFVIMKQYPVSSHPFIKQLIHIDAYRLEKPEQVSVLEWDELVANPDNLIIVEWPEKISEFLPEQVSELRFTYFDDNKRSIEH